MKKLNILISLAAATAFAAFPAFAHEGHEGQAGEEVCRRAAKSSIWPATSTTTPPARSTPTARRRASRWACQSASRPNDGKTYLLIGEHKPINSELVSLAAKTITVKGKLVSRDGFNMIENAEIVKK